MPNTSVVKNNFSAGEVSPRIMGRPELAAYQAGCFLLENMIPLPNGGAIRRPGTYYAGTTRNSDPGRLIPVPKSYPFNASMAEFTESHLRMWDTKKIALLRDSSGTFDLSSPYITEHLAGVTGLAVGSQVVVVHKGVENRSGGAYAPYAMSRGLTIRSSLVAENVVLQSTDTDFAFTAVQADLQRWGVAAGMVVWTGSTTTGRGRAVAITAVSGPTALSLSTQIVVKPYWWEPPATAPAPPPPTPGIAYGPGRVQPAHWIYPSVTVSIYPGSTSYKVNSLVDTNGDFVTKAVVANDIVCNVRTRQQAKVLARVGATELTLDADIFPVAGDPYTIELPTFTFAAMTFSGARNFAAAGSFPSVVFAAQGRLGFAGTLNEPDLVALSRSPAASTGTYRTTDFTLGTAADDAVIVYASDGKNGAVRWAACHRRLCLGTEFGTWQGPSGALSATTFAMDYINGQCSANVAAVSIDKAVFYISAPRPHLHMLTYSQEGGGMMDIDLSEYWDHILEPGVKTMVAMASPFPMVWILRTDGVLVSCTVKLTGESFMPGWARHPMVDNATVEDLAMVTEVGGDVLWMIVNRPGIGRTVEYLSVKTEESDDFSEVHYVDCGVGFHQTSSATVSGLSHLEGREVDGVCDGGSMPRVTVSGGAVTYDRAVETVHIGLPYQSMMIPTDPELAVNGTWQAKKKRVEKVTLRLLRTIGGKVSAGGSATQDIPYFTPGVTILGSPASPFTGDIVIDSSGQVDTHGVPTIIQDQPWPLTILSIISRVAILEQ